MSSPPLQIEGMECGALQGMRRFLNSSRVVGLAMEFSHNATVDCCTQLVAPGGAFSVLWHEHGLCPELGFGALFGPRGWPKPIDFTNVCRRRGDLLWSRAGCENEPADVAARAQAATEAWSCNEETEHNPSARVRAEPKPSAPRHCRPSQLQPRPRIVGSEYNLS